MRHMEKHHTNAQANTGDIYSAGLIRQLHDERLIETDGDGDFYVEELARRISMQDSEDGQSAVAFDWIN